MIRQLRRLTHPVPGLGPGVSAIAVYSEATRGGMRQTSAAETGFEGVACVDDTSRLASLYIALWRDSGKPHWRTAALEALAFVRAMQTAEGWFHNFITGWDGAKNRTGRTSADPYGPWLARACYALADGAAAFEDADCADAFARAVRWLDQPTPYLDVRAVAVLAALRYAEATPGAVDDRAERWAVELYESRCHGFLPDVWYSSSVHLWGHLQESALARAAVHFGRPEWIEAARQSVEALIVPAVERSFAASTTIAFDVSCAIKGLSDLHAATGDTRYEKYIQLARSWFVGRNRAGLPVFDRRRGLVYDGIDEGRVSANSGAEANIEGALALM